MMSVSSKPCLTILIKALNEESHIAACLNAAVSEAQALGGEIILVDSLSTDNTVAIARQYPIRIIQFERIEDRGCGAAVQLGYQYARGDFIYVLDADMELQPGFIARALEYLENNPAVAGVGGLIIDTRKITPDDRRRAEHYSSLNDTVLVDHLGGGGLFRRNAIASVDYLANRWLKACEEGDLGIRLMATGWHLVRLPVPAVRHTGHNESGLEMIFRLWHNGRMQAYGVFLHNAIGRPWWRASIKHAWFVFAAPTVYLTAFFFSWVQASVGIEPHKALLTSVTLLWGLVFLVLWKKKRDAANALLSILAWHFYTTAAVPGFLKKITDPNQPISAYEIK
ncbi:MAG: glycosyltransferase family 2 protein [Methylococcales bacterium]|nr:glycosyltransferase family 2 protein [Methylococcales bacterium]